MRRVQTHILPRPAGHSVFVCNSGYGILSRTWSASSVGQSYDYLKLFTRPCDVLLGQKTLCSANLGRAGKYFSHARQLLRETVARIMNNEVSLPILVGEGIEQTPVHNARAQRIAAFA